MKKVVIIVIAVLGLAVAGYFLLAKKTQAPTGTSQNNSQSNLATNTKDAVKSGVKDSLLALMAGTTGVKCAVEDENGKYTVIAKDKKVRIEGIDFANPADSKTVGQKGMMISDGIWVYMWGGKEGLKFNIEDMDETSATQGGEVSKDSDWRDWAKSMDASGAKHDCKPGMATDGDFTPPTDVKFQDWGEMMKNLQQLQANPGAIDPSKFQIPE